MKSHQLLYYHGVIIISPYCHLSFKVTTACDCCAVSVLQLVPAKHGDLAINQTDAFAFIITQSFRTLHEVRAVDEEKMANQQKQVQYESEPPAPTVDEDVQDRTLL